LMSATEIHPTAIVAPRAQLGAGVKIGPFTIVHDGATLEENVQIGSHCEIGIASPLARSQELHIGRNALIRSHSRFYVGSRFGRDMTTGHGVTVRENTTVGDGFQLGTDGDIQGDCTIGDYTKTQSLVHIGKHAQIGSYCWLFMYACLTNDPHPPSHVQMGVIMEDFVVIGTQCTVLPGVRLGKGCLVGAGSIVRKDVAPDMIVAPAPSEIRGPTANVKMRDGSGRPAYPWRTHFHRGYPEEVVAQWLKEAGETASAA